MNLSIKRLAILFLLFSPFILFAQPVNDDCANAEVLMNLDGGCTVFNTDLGSFDLANGDCAPASDAINVWYQFTAQGNDIEIITNSGNGGEVTVTLLEFSPIPCDFASALQIACGASGGGVAIDLNDALVVGNTYYIIVNAAGGVEGNGNICVDNPIPTAAPPNDDSCASSSIGDDCVGQVGSTFGADEDFTGSIGGCTLGTQVGVFYEFTVSAGNNSATITVNNIGLGGEVTVVLGEWATDCNGNINVLDIYCGNPGTDLLDVSGLTEGSSYVVWVASEEAAAGDFDIAVCGYGPPPGCAINDFCDMAEIVTGVVSDEPYTCVSGCNIGASSEAALPGCNMATEEVVWFEFTTDNSATLASFYVEGDNDLQAPTIQVFSGTCGNLIIEDQCISGDDAYVQLLNIDVSPNTTYYIAISNEYGDGGTFNLCIQTLDDPSSCVLDASLEVVNTSLGSPPGGPFKPAEQVEFCYSISNFTTAGNECQWLQGIIPIFGCAWAESSFDAAGMPVNITVPITTQYSGIWGWFTDVTYNLATTTKSVGDFDGDGDLDMCHYTEPQCSNTGIAAGQIMPPGWYSWTPNSGAPGTGHPNVEYGDGQGCNGSNGGWQVCFVLTTKSAPECESCEEASVKIYTTADGETGGWSGNGGSGTCGNDIPKILDLNMNCCIGPILDLPLEETICSGSTSGLELFSDQDPNVTYEWTPINNPAINGASAGVGKFITQTLENTTTVIQTQIYEVIPVNNEGCPGLPQFVQIHVLPAIIVDAGPDIEGCAQGTFTLGGTPTALGGNGFFDYDWGNSSVANTANPTASPNIPTTYVVTVTDDNGCSATDDIFLDINPNFDAEITGEFNLCDTDPTSFITGTPLGGTPGYSYIWQGPGATGGASSVLYYDGGGLSPGTYTITLTVTDSNGCTGDVEQEITINQSPNIFFFTDPDNAAFCPGGSVEIDAQVLGTPGATFEYNWITPDGPKTGQVITADTEGTYELEVVDPSGCIGVESIFIDEVPTPEPEMIANTDVCVGETTVITLDTIYEVYQWSDSSSADSLIAGPGTYQVTVTNIGGCTGEDVITINENPEPDVSIAGSTTFCVGSSTILSATGGYTIYEWTDDTGNIISDVDTVYLTEAGEVTLVVEDGNGCTNLSTVTIEIEDFLVPNILGDTSLCPGSCTSLNAGAGYSSYIWSNDSTSQEITVCDPGEYTVTVTDAGGCSGELTKTVIVNTPPSPEISTNTGTTSICLGESITLDAGEFSSYNWNTNDGDQQITVSDEGIYTVTVTDDEGCESTDEIEITIDPDPVPGYLGETTICPEGSTTITPDDGFVLYEIDFNNDGIIDISSPTNDAFTINNSGITSIIVTDTNGCMGNVIIEVDLFDSPQPETSLDTASYCIGGNVTVSLTQDYDQIQWYDPNNNAIGTSQSISVNEAGIYTIDVIDANGCLGSTEMVVIEATELSPSIFGATTMCDLTPIELDAGAGYDTYDWGPDGNTQTITVTNPGEYTVTVYDGGGCSGEASIIIQNFNSPMIELEDAFICNHIEGNEGVIINFNDLVIGSDGFWSDEDGAGVDLITDISNVSFEGVTAGNYIFKYTTTTAVSPCVNIEGFITIEVGDCQCPDVSTLPISDVCESDAAFNLNDFKDNSEPGTWSIVNGSGGSPLNGSIFTPSDGNIGSYTVRFTLDNPIDDCDEFSEQSFIIQPNANAGVDQGSFILCYGSDEVVDLHEIIAGEEMNGEWKEQSTIPSTGSAFDQNGTFNVVNQEVGIYIFQYKVEGLDPCPDDSTQIIVQIVENPVADAGPDQMLDCETTEVTLTGNSSGDQVSYFWSETKGIAIENPNSEEITVDQEGNYVLEIIDINNCLDTDTTIVELSTEVPNLEVEVTDPKCHDESNGIISVSTVGGTAPFQYSIDGGATWVTNTGFLDLTSGEYTVLVEDDLGCIDEQVVLLDNPIALNIDIDGELILTDLNSTNLELDYNIDENDIQNVIWYVNDTIVCEGANCLTYGLDLTGQTGVFEVCVDLINSNNCSISTCVTVRKSNIISVFIPNIFSPNQDSENDYFFVQGDQNVVMVNKMMVFDRWGNRVFFAEDIPPNVPDAGWDGTFNDGDVLQGVYTYLVEVAYENGETELLDGSITVLR